MIALRPSIEDDQGDQMIWKKMPIFLKVAK